MRSRWHRGARIAGRQLFGLTVVLTALLMLLLGSAFWLSAAVEQRKDEIAQWIGEHLGHTTEIGEVGVYWFALFPKLQVSAFNVLSETDTPILSAEQIYIGLDLWQTLMQRQLVIDAASVSGLELEVMRQTDGSLLIAQGVYHHDFTNTGRDNPLPEDGYLFRKLELTEVVIHYQDQVDPQLTGRYQIPALSLQHQQPAWQLSAHLLLPQHLGETLQVDARLSLVEQRVEQWQLQAETRQVRLADLLGERTIQGVQLTRGRADVAIHAHYAAERMTASGQVALNRAHLVSMDTERYREPVSLDQFATRFDWRQDQQDWQLTLNQARIQIDGERWPETDLFISGTGQTLTQASADFIRLGHVSDLNQLLETPNAYLTQYQPAGDIANVSLKLKEADTLESLTLELRDIVFLGVDALPGMSGVSGTVSWQNDTLQAELNASTLTLYPGEWLEDAISFETATATLQWLKTQDGWQLEVTDARLVNTDLNIQLAGQLSTDAQQWQTDAEVEIHYFSAPAWQKYTPVSLLDPDFIAWAETAFVAGEVQHGRIALKGDPLAYPFETDPDAGEFSMTLEATDVDLLYFPGWPMLTGVNGTVTSTGNDLQIVASQGTIFNYRFDGVSAEINPLVKGRPFLSVNGQVLGDARDGLGFLDNSPLKEQLGALTEAISATGDVQLQLQLEIPLLAVSESQVVGDIHFIDNELTLSLLPTLPITQVNGDLRFTNKTVTAKAIQARVLEESAEVAVMTDEALRIQILGKTTAEIQSLGRLWDGEMLPELQGRTAVTAEITIAEVADGDYAVHVGVHSDLQGVSSDLPAPLNKSANEILAFNFDYWPDRVPDIQARLADWLTFSLATDPVAPRMNLMAGDGVSQLPPEGFSVTGSLDVLQLDNWLNWLAAKEETSEQQLPAEWLPNQIAVQIQQLHIGQHTIHDFSTVAEQRNQAWQIALAAEEFKGDVHWPLESSVLPTLHFDYMDISLPENVGQPTDIPSSPTALWPGFTLNIDNLTINKMPLGRLQAHASRPNPNRWELVSATLTSDELEASATGQWHRLPAEEQTQLDLTLNSRDIASLLVKLGYQPAMTANHATIDMALRWPGEPLSFNRADFFGQMSLSVGAGQLKEVDPGAAGRIFGLFSMTALPRRLTLDFSDLFRGGMGFSSINGQFDFAGGIAHTRDLTMRGDSALIEIQGPINLVTQTYNQTVKVTPSVSSTLPLAGAVAGGPVGLGVGTAIFLADRIVEKIFNREIVNLISYRYQLTGPWNAPEMTLSRTTEQ